MIVRGKFNSLGKIINGFGVILSRKGRIPYSFKLFNLKNMKYLTEKKKTNKINITLLSNFIV
jgi:hypothetical protein